MLKSNLIRISLTFVLCCFSLIVMCQGWEQLSTPSFEGRHHAIGFASDQYGYVVSGSGTTDVWRYDPSDDSWLQLDDYSNIERGFGIGDMAGDVGYFGFGFVFGGGNQGLARDLWKFDIPTETFEELSSCPCESRAHPAFVVVEDKIYMGLGSGDNGNLGDWWEYDIPTDSWTEREQFPGANRHHPYQFEIDGMVYVGSGHYDDWYKYDPSTDSWTQISDHPSYTRVAGIQFSYEGKGYTLSGVADYNNDDHLEMPTGEFWEYDPDTDQWTELPPHPGMSRWASASFIIDDYIYMIAGETYDGETANYRYPLSDGISSVNELNVDGASIYPNPFEEYIVIDSKRNWTQARLLDLSGSAIQTFRLTTNRLEVGELNSGGYILELTNESEVMRKLLVKE